MDDRQPHPTDASVAPPGRLAGAPFIPAAVDPDVEAARAVPRRRALRDDAPADDRRVIALLVDLLAIAVVVAAGRDVDPAVPVAAVGLLAWAVLRYLPLALFGKTAGHALAGYEIRGPRGARLGPLRAAFREGLLFVGPALVVWFATGTPAGGASVELRNDGDRRWPHDLLTDCWAVRTRG